MLLTNAYQTKSCDPTSMASHLDSLRTHILRFMAFAILLVAMISQGFCFTVIFNENFDTLPLGPPVDEDSMNQNAFTQQPPPGWNLLSSLVPGRGDPLVGVEEWEGWSFADKNFWAEVALPAGGPSIGPRDEFQLGQGTIAVADPDQWNDLGDPANEIGFYNTFLTTPVIDLSTAPDDQLKLVFDTAWVGGCCDDGESFDPNGNNQTGILKANLPGGGQIELLRWESAPFRDSQGLPSNNPLDTPNPFFKPDNLNERIAIDITGLLSNSSATTSNALLQASMTGGVSFEFGMEDAGDDGYWALDNISMISFTTLLGDMDISGALDAGDIDAFALGMVDEDEYSFNYFGEFPVSRGSVDSTFDFDDIPWFVGVMEGAGLASAATALAHALAPVPEPSSALLIGVAMLGLLRRPRN